MNDIAIHFLLRLKSSLGTEIHLNLEVLTYHPLICTINHLKFIVSNQMEQV